MTAIRNIDSRSASISLPAVVSIWRMRLPGKQLESDDRLLSSDERERASRFVFDRDRARFVAARAFLRRTLARHLDEDPAVLRFTYGAYGRPRLDESGPEFNLSHAGDFVFLAVSWASPLGVDIESVRPMADRDALAGQIMHPAELASFERLAEDERTSSFFRLWTRKEAALKASGRGFSVDPRSLYIGVERTGQESRIVLDGVASTIRDLAAPANYAAAICAPEGAAIELRHRRIEEFVS